MGTVPKGTVPDNPEGTVPDNPKGTVPIDYRRPPNSPRRYAQYSNVSSEVMNAAT